MFLYPNPKNEKSESKQVNGDSNSSSASDCRYDQFANVDDMIVANFKALMHDGCHEKDIRSDSLIAGSMSMALCCILFLNLSN